MPAEPTRPAEPPSRAEPMRIAVTGASGQFGRGVVAGLVERVGPESVIALTRDPSRIADPGVETRAADFDDPRSLAEALRGAQRLLLVSTATIGLRRGQHRAAIAAAVQAGIGHLFYTSVIGVDDVANPAPVVPDHRDTEAALRESGLRFTALRNGIYTETLLLAVRPAVAAGVYATNGGDGATSYVTRGDLAAATAAILGDPADPGRVLELTGSEAVNGRDVAAILTGLTGRDVRFQPLTDEIIETGMTRAGLPPAAIALALGFGQAARGGYLGRITDTLERYLDRSPVSVAEFLAHHRSALTALEQTA